MQRFGGMQEEADDEGQEGGGEGATTVDLPDEQESQVQTAARMMNGHEPGHITPG